MSERAKTTPADLGALRRAVAERPDSVEAHLDLGTALLRQGIAPEAEAELNRALELDPSCAGAWVNLGGLRLARWDFAGCVEANDRALATEPDLLIAHFNRGLGFLYLKQPAEMIACFRRVIALDPHHAAGHYYLAVGLLAAQVVDEAQAALARATTLGYSAPPEFLKAMDQALHKKSDGGVTTFEIGTNPKPENN